MIDHLDVAYGARKRRTILDSAHHRFDARGLQITGLLGAAHERPDAISPASEGMGEMAAREPGRSGD